MSRKSPEGDSAGMKSLGALIPEDVYWDFKKVQAARKESNAQALINAVRLYIEIGNQEEGQVK